METFPTIFPNPTSALSNAQEVNTVRTNMDSGTVRQRRRFTVEMNTTNVTWEMDDTTFSLFQAWHKYKLNLGTDWFLISMPLGGGFQTQQARFVDGAYSQQYAEVGFWTVTAKMDVLDRPTVSETTLDVYLEVLAANDTIENFLASVDAFHNLVHVTLPINLN